MPQVIRTHEGGVLPGENPPVDKTWNLLLGLRTDNDNMKVIEVSPFGYLNGTKKLAADKDGNLVERLFLKNSDDSRGEEVSLYVAPEIVTDPKIEELEAKVAELSESLETAQTEMTNAQAEATRFEKTVKALEKEKKIATKLNNRQAAKLKKLKA